MPDILSGKGKVPDILSKVPDILSGQERIRKERGVRFDERTSPRSVKQHESATRKRRDQNGLKGRVAGEASPPCPRYLKKGLKNESTPRKT